MFGKQKTAELSAYPCKNPVQIDGKIGKAINKQAPKCIEQWETQAKPQPKGYSNKLVLIEQMSWIKNKFADRAFLSLLLQKSRTIYLTVYVFTGEDCDSEFWRKGMVPSFEKDREISRI